MEEKLLNKLKGKRDFSFEGLPGLARQDVEQFVIDEQASYSVTEASLADFVSLGIMQQRHRIDDRRWILDGMACVGGNTISFARHFSHVLANEYDERRFEMLKHNTTCVARSRNVKLRRGSILDMWKEDCALMDEFKKYDVLFLDPEWGGVEYGEQDAIELQIGGELMDRSVEDAFKASKKLRWVVLKLPRNYDKDQIDRLAGMEIGGGDCIGVVGRYRLFQRGTQKMAIVVLERIAKMPEEESVDVPSVNEKRPEMATGQVRVYIC